MRFEGHGVPTEPLTARQWHKLARNKRALAAILACMRKFQHTMKRIGTQAQISVVFANSFYKSLVYTNEHHCTMRTKFGKLLQHDPTRLQLKIWKGFLYNIHTNLVHALKSSPRSHEKWLDASFDHFFLFLFSIKQNLLYLRLLLASYIVANGYSLILAWVWYVLLFFSFDISVFLYKLNMMCRAR